MHDPCPRCGTENEGLDACPRCGLGRAHRGAVTPPDLPEWLAAEWKTVVERWGDAAAHAIFIERCAAAEALDLAARRYRLMLADPARADRARASLDRIVVLAQAAMTRAATPRSRIARNKAIALVAGVVVALALLAMMVHALVSR